MRPHLLVGWALQLTRIIISIRTLPWPSNLPEALLACQGNLEEPSSHARFIAMAGKRKNRNAVALGRRGGLKGGPKGGKARWEGVSKEQRQAIARKAAFARWGRAKKTKTGKRGR
jgi:hypothetical protein